MGGAVDIMQLSCIQTELLVFLSFSKNNRHLQYKLLCHFVSQPYLEKVTRVFRSVPCGSEMAAKRSVWG